MKARIRRVTAFLLVFALLVGFALIVYRAWMPPGTGNAVRGSGTRAADYRLAGPHSHDNLTVFLIRGPETLPGRTFLTLQEALEQNKVVVHETSDVNELAVENLSDEEVYIQSGEIVKGGQQDRVLQTDLIVSARSGRVPLAAFCVEQGRWAGRGKESAVAFSSSDSMLNTKGLKLANAYSRSQPEVWENVARAQRRLAENVGEEARDPSSSSVCS
jgi:hypothetical protein